MTVRIRSYSNAGIYQRPKYLTKTFLRLWLLKFEVKLWAKVLVFKMISQCLHFNIAWKLYNPFRSTKVNTAAIVPKYLNIQHWMFLSKVVRLFIFLKTESNQNYWLGFISNRLLLFWHSQCFLCPIQIPNTNQNIFIIVNHFYQPVPQQTY